MLSAVSNLANATKSVIHAVHPRKRTKS